MELASETRETPHCTPASITFIRPVRLTRMSPMASKAPRPVTARWQMLVMSCFSPRASRASRSVTSTFSTWTRPPNSSLMKSGSRQVW